MNLLGCLLGIAERSGEIARGIRADPKTLRCLTEEKGRGDDEKNWRFERDFKTLADVLIQEMARSEIARHFPQLASRIFGEESALITNANGTSVQIAVGRPELTETALRQILEGDLELVQTLNRLVYPERTDDGQNGADLPEETGLSWNLDDLGIWIDPIGQLMFSCLLYGD